MTSRQIAVFRGDDASPEVMDPTLEILRDLNLDLEFIFPLVGAEAIEQTGERFPCLLYTSPSPRDYAASRMPSSA